jgi:hypothetical protein
MMHHNSVPAGSPCDGSGPSDGAGDPSRAVSRHQLRQEFLLERLRQADGITYDDLCREIVEAFPDHKRWRASARGVREVRWLLWSGLAVTEPDESIWMTPAGWAVTAP